MSELRDYPIVANAEKENVSIIGRIKVPEEIADKIADGTLSLGIKTKGLDFGKKLIHLTLGHNPKAFRQESDEKIRKFFVAAQQLLRGEWHDTTQVPELILKKLELLKIWKILKDKEEDCPHLARTRFVGCGGWAYWVCDECEEIVGKKHKAEEEGGEKP